MTYTVQTQYKNRFTQGLFYKTGTQITTVNNVYDYFFFT